MSVITRPVDALRELDIDPWLELAALSALLMRIAWVAPIYRLLVVEATNVHWLQAVGVLLAFAVVSYSAVKLMTARGMNRSGIQTFAMLVLAILIVAGFNLLLLPHEPIHWADALRVPLEDLGDARNVIPDEAPVFAAVVFVWYSAFTLARQGIGTSRVLEDFSRGAIVFFLFTIFNSDFPLWEFAVYLGIFLFSGLLSLKTARMGALHRFRNAAAIPFTLGWVGGLGGVILAVALISLGAGVAFAGALGQVLVGLLTWSLYILALIVISPILRAASPMLGWLQQRFVEEGSPFWQANLPNFGDGAAGGLLGDATALEGMEAEQVLENTTLDPLGWGVLIAITVLLISIAIWRSRELGQRMLAERRELQDSERLSMVDAVRSLLSTGLQEAWGRLRGTPARIADRLRAAQRVRRIYAQFLDLCTDLNIPRPAAKTPLEFVPVAANALEGQADRVMMLTNAYLKVRYGGLPENEDEVKQVEAAWRDVRAVGEAILKNRRS